MTFDTVPETLSVIVLGVKDQGCGGFGKAPRYRDGLTTFAVASSASIFTDGADR